MNLFIWQFCRIKYNAYASTSRKRFFSLFLFPYFSLDFTCNTNNEKILKAGEKADQLGTLGPEEQHSDKFPGFPFYPIYAGVGAEKQAAQYTKGTDHKKSLSKSLVSQTKRSRKGQHSKTKKISDINFSSSKLLYFFLVSNTTEKL